jgi:hypothetical protein
MARWACSVASRRSRPHAALVDTIPLSNDDTRYEEVGRSAEASGIGILSHPRSRWSEHESTAEVASAAWYCGARRICADPRGIDYGAGDFHALSVLSSIVTTYSRLSRTSRNSIAPSVRGCARSTSQAGQFHDDAPFARCWIVGRHCSTRSGRSDARSDVLLALSSSLNHPLQDDVNAT